jgi:micrococcal nuclease|tara:strand:- start:124 stop:540 length:417 start_codon:yes stop_codon:yes gene_type:complete
MVKKLLAVVLLGISLQVNAECFPVTEVIKVVDGDTVDVQIRVKPLDLDLLANMRIRMEGINAWESRSRNLEEKALGLAAKQRLSELVLAPITVCLSGKGKFGRWLGTLFDGETNINEQLVQEGHAQWYDGGKRKQFGE